MTVDTKRGIVYVPTGSAVFDFYGGDRVGDDLFADTLLALDAETGKRIWHFQGVHHDLWDRDFPAPPVMVTITHDGKRVDAIAQTTKSGLLFVFDRATGQPIFPIKELRFPKSNVPLVEATSPTQPMPTLPAPYTQQSTTEDTLTNRTPEAMAWAVKQFSTMIGGGQFVPPSDKLTVDMPGFAGGREWGGVAVDQFTRALYVKFAVRHCLAGWADDSTAGGKFGREGLPEPVQWLSRHQPRRLAPGDSSPMGNRGDPYRSGDCRRHPPGQGPHAFVQQSE